MDVFKAIKNRRSIRKYRARPVELEKLDRILEATRLSPSACNIQPWDIIVVKSEETRNRMAEAYRREWFLKAPVIIALCATPTKAWRRNDGEEFWKIDGAIAMQTLIIAATAEGLGTCWIGDFDEKKAKEILGVPEETRIVALTPLGYSDKKKGPVTDRKPLEQIVHFDRW
jgi:nitroreductase